MFKKYSPLLLISILIVGCEQTTNVQISPESFSEKELNLCATTSCPEISVNYITVSGEADIAKDINSVIMQFCIESLYLGDEAMPATATTIAEAAEQFIQMYRTHSAEFPDMQMAYFAKVEVRESYFTDVLLSVELRRYLFTGGAHGYGTTQFANFDLETGKELPNEALFKEYDTFEMFAETQFRLAYDIPSGASINSSGFWFEEDLFYLPESIGFTDSALILIYNQYEIASYAAGPIELEIPLKDVEPYLAIPLR